jgi:beta-galactosidase
MNKIGLNYDWDYIPSYKETYINDFPKATSVHIPHTNKTLPFNNFSENAYQFISSYQKTIEINKKEDKRYVIQFDGVMTYAEVYVNQTFVGSHKGGYTPFKIDITDIIHTGDNKIFVKVDSRERKDIPPFGFVVDYLTYGGIYREVYLIEYEANYIDQVFIDYLDQDLQLRVFSKKHHEITDHLTFHISKNDQEIGVFDRYFSYDDQTVIKEAIRLDLWTLEQPTLYTLTIKKGDIILFQSRFANRRVAFKDDGFYLNDKKIKLIGLNRHQSYPYVGYAMPSNAQRKDADILKYDLGVNTVRSSHYPPSKHFLDRCDEIGLLVFNEIPGWQHIGDENWRDIAIENTREMIYRDYNHPSIFIWGTRINESPDHDDFYEKTNQIAKSMDPYRPNGGVRNFAGSHLIEDVYTFNDFVHRGNNIGLQKRKKIAKKKVPYMVTEYNGHMYPTKKFDDEWHRINHTKRHLNVQNDNFKHDDIAGAIGWCMFDYNTHKDFGSGDRVCYHGVLDMFRIPKYAASVYSMQGEKPYMEVLGNLNIGEQEASEVKEVMVMTNADYVKFYINDTFINDFYPSKEAWSHLPHAPIIVDDFIGNMIHENEPYSSKDCDTIKEVLLSVMRTGINIPLRLKLKMLIFLKKNKLSFDQAAIFYEKYIGKWGLESVSYKFQAIKDDHVVGERIIGSTDTHHLQVEVDDQVLSETDTYQTSRIVVKHINDNKNPMTYSQEVIHIDIVGPLALIGPSSLALTGGSTAFFVKTMQKKGLAKITISSSNLESQKIEIKVK